MSLLFILCAYTSGYHMWVWYEICSVASTVQSRNEKTRLNSDFIFIELNILISKGGSFTLIFCHCISSFICVKTLLGQCWNNRKNFNINYIFDYNKYHINFPEFDDDSMVI